MAQPLTATLRFVSHPAPRVIAASESIHTLLGFTAAQFLDGSVDWVQRVHPDDIDITDRLLDVHLSPAQGSCNIRLRHQDGRIRCIKLDYRWNQPEAPPAAMDRRARPLPIVRQTSRDHQPVRVVLLHI